MKPYYKLQCDQLSIIQEKTLQYLINYTSLLEDKPVQLWNKIKTVDYLKNCPELVHYCKSLGLAIKEVAFTVVKEPNNVPLHIDELPTTAKINFPILNTPGTRNCWYSIPTNILEQYPPITNAFGSTYYSFDNLDLNLCTKIADIELDTPTVFNSQIPHMVTVPHNAVFPRIVMPVMFFKEPLNYLEE